MLNPRNPIIREFFRENPGVGLAMQGDVLVPRGFAHEEGKEVMVEFDPDYGAAWLAFANCKGLWLGEASHREEMTGTAERHFSSVEELECLASAAVVHASQREKGEEGAMDTSLDGLVAIIEDGMGTELVLFEMAARVHPQYTLDAGGRGPAAAEELHPPVRAGVDGQLVSPPRALTPRALVLGSVIGAVMCLSNLYVGLKTGIAFPVALIACVVGVGVWRVWARLRPSRAGMGLSLAETSAMQSTASSAGYSTGGTIITRRAWRGSCSRASTLRAGRSCCGRGWCRRWECSLPCRSSARFFGGSR